MLMGEEREGGIERKRESERKREREGGREKERERGIHLAMCTQDESTSLVIVCVRYVLSPLPC